MRPCGLKLASVLVQRPDRIWAIMGSPWVGLGNNGNSITRQQWEIHGWETMGVPWIDLGNNSMGGYVVKWDLHGWATMVPPRVGLGNNGTSIDVLKKPQLPDSSQRHQLLAMPQNLCLPALNTVGITKYC